ncbi:MAG: Fic family protein [Planctomycetes bacterium]|nr:Fic family protein [Planctomycetota bacterium]
MAWFDGIVTEAPGALVDTIANAKAFLPSPLPVGVELPPDLHRLIAEARAQLGVLDGIGRLSANPLLFVQPFQVSEAAASSRIEGTKTTDEEALANEVTGISSSDPDAKEVDNYLRALRYGVKAINGGRPLSPGLVLELHKMLLDGVRGHTATPGKYREGQVFIGKADINSARFVPPPALHVLPCMESLYSYLDAPSPDDPLVRVALVHYQFETIHPFEDGNGRIGRLLVALQTIRQGLQRLPLLYVSARLEAQREEYYDRLLEVSLRKDFIGWIRFFVEAMRASAEETSAKFHGLVATMKGFRDQLRRCSTTGPGRLLERLEQHPFLTVAIAAKHLGVTTPTAQAAITELEELGIVKLHQQRIQRGPGRPAKVYFSPALLQILRPSAASSEQAAR